MEFEVVREDPPQRGRGEGRRRWQPVFEKVKAEGGAWCRIHTSDTPHQAYTLAGSLRMGKAAGVAIDEFEVTSRKLGDGRGATYARWTGGE